MGSQLSFALYLFAAAGLILVASPAMTGTLNASRESIGIRIMDGLRDVVDNLHPGMKVKFVIPPDLPGRSIRLNDNTISMSLGNRTESVSVSTSFVSGSLFPSHAYELRITSEGVEANELG